MDIKVTSVNARRRFKDRLVFTLGLGRKPLRFFCDHCGKYIPSDVEWKCGFCDFENRQARVYSFLNKCKRCKQSAPSFRCPHCGDILFLDGRRDDSHVAVKIGSSEPRDMRLEGVIQSRRDREKELQHDMVTTRLNKELDTLQKEIETAKQGSPYFELKEERSKRKARLVAAHIIAKQERETNKKEFGDDAELLEMANSELQDWLDHQALGGGQELTRS
jgi:hypothetical protein